MTSSPFDFYGPNEAYILELYERYQTNPETLDTATRQFFAQWTPDLATHEVIEHPEETITLNPVSPFPVAESVVSEVTLSTFAETSLPTQKIVGAVNYANAIRQFGHTVAQLDPLGNPPPGDPELTPEAHGITHEDLHQLPASVVGEYFAHMANAFEATQELRQIYCHTIGYDNDHIRIPEERMWLRDAIETRRYRFSYDNATSRELLERLTQVEAFENFLQRTFPTKYRFSIEGLDMMVPILDEMIYEARISETATVVLAMAHRGRLNVLAHIMKKPYEQILSEFRDPVELQEMREAIGWTIGDVKYHTGQRHVLNNTQQIDILTLTMPPNPSHLEAVNPVAVGMARAAGTRTDHRGIPHFDPRMTMQILIHGDASFPGQGLVAETFNLSRLPGYWTGGTIHIIANNQIGFTTLPHNSRSTLYASDLAKGFKVPVVHVNADDPAACLEVARIAHAYQQKFEKDFLIDLVGYRRYGHNELDEPGFTQPLMYKQIREHMRVRQMWGYHLIERGQIDPELPEQLLKKAETELQEIYEALPPIEEIHAPPPPPPPPGVARKTETAVSEDRLRRLNTSLEHTISDFPFYSKRLENVIRARREAFAAESPMLDWATAEELALASILEDGIPVRLTGQDSERGTFSHRHAVLYNAHTGESLTPLQVIPEASATFEIRNSALSEAAVLGFEFGYNMQASNRLVIWEAQYGDFNNNAQVIIDEFIVSAREKWGLTPSLVMLLPHGYEGAGPDHSSARLERFLQLAAKTNLRIATCTNAAQYFHVLRRQALLLRTDPLPLIIMSPKSLLRNPMVASPLSAFTQGKWQPVIDDLQVDPENVTRLVLCSGKFYLDLLTSPWREKNPHVAIGCVEQLYPFPAQDLQAVISRYPQLNYIVWAQEEPKNMGAWEFMHPRLQKVVNHQIPVDYVGRRRSSSPAEGSKTAHSINQEMITEYAFNWDFAIGKPMR